MDTVVFACVHNAGRSQMAAAFFNALAVPTKARAVSAGTQPGLLVHPEVIAAMLEVAIDLSGITPRLLEPEDIRHAALLVTMGCGEACPVIAGLERADWPVPDPKGKGPEDVRAIRDGIRSRVLELVRARGWGNPAV